MQYLFMHKALFSCVKEPYRMNLFVLIFKTITKQNRTISDAVSFNLTAH